MIGQTLTISSVALQSLGKVLFGTFLTGVSLPLFLLVGFLITAAAFLARVRFHMPREGRIELLLMNFWTAVCFISFFYALNHLPPAMLASIEIGMSLLTTIALVGIAQRAWPRLYRVLAGLGIVAGCALLTWAELRASEASPSSELIWTAILASMATGVSAALATISSKRLANAGWTPSTVIAHRFYLMILVAAGWLLLEPGEIVMPSPAALLPIALVGAVTVLIPIFMLQVAIRSVDELTIVVCLAAQPVISFLLSLPSPAYEWRTATLLGVLVVTFFVGLDIALQRWRTSRKAVIRPRAWPAISPSVRAAP